MTHWKRPWCWEGLGAGGEGDDGAWGDWMASPTRWTWIWVNSRSWWWTGRPGVLWFMGSQRVRHNWATELNWTYSLFLTSYFTSFCFVCSLNTYYENKLFYHFCLLAFLLCLYMVDLLPLPYLPLPMSFSFHNFHAFSCGLFFFI